MNLIKIKEFLATMPTMMDLKDEKQIYQRIMDAESEINNHNISLLSEIINDLQISRSSSFYEITDSDKPFFLTFSNWLKDLAGKFSGPRIDEFVYLARIYSEFPKKG